ncbi:sugar MFS transporter [Sphingorhabdus sp.]|jgi:FHS family L-fucose permease-like MFS transporter|uniref:sugar MFS transporter n=1 Tax=Sphingorhabdus sp. TaxID=1902408 RepID=UPI0037CC8577
MALAPSGNATAGDGMKIEGKARSVLFLTFAVFFILGGVTNINDVLIPKLKNLYQLSHFEANLVQFAFFMSYALFSIPAGMLVARIGYVRGFVAGFLVVAAGALLFLPAANSGIYASFLAALFVIGGGITLLQVGMNPVTIALGPKETSHSRLTFAQLFNSIGVFLMVYGGAELMLGKESGVDPSTLSGAALQAHRVAESAVIGHAYMWLAAAMAAIAGLFWFWRSALDKAEAVDVKVGGTLALFLNNARVRFGALCIFTYVGAEVAIGSNLIAYLTDDGVMGITAVEAGRMLALYWGGAMVGRFFGGFVLRMFKPGLVLTAFAATAIALILLSGMSSGAIAGWSLVLVGFFNSLMFPTIFSLGTEGLTDDAPRASGIMCTAIVGGALVPPLFGLVADGAGLKLALVVPIICYAIIATFGLWAAKRA